MVPYDRYSVWLAAFLYSLLPSPHLLRLQSLFRLQSIFRLQSLVRLQSLFQLHRLIIVKSTDYSTLQMFWDRYSLLQACLSSFGSAFWFWFAMGRSSKEEQELARMFHSLARVLNAVISVSRNATLVMSTSTAIHSVIKTIWHLVRTTARKRRTTHHFQVMQLWSCTPARQFILWWKPYDTCALVRTAARKRRPTHHFFNA